MSLEAALGEPHVQVGHLLLWVHGYERQEADNEYDRNWLRATAICSASGARVEVSGSFLLTGELASWADALSQLRATLKGEANLSPIEPDLSVTVAAGSLGHLTVEVRITPDQLHQEHVFRFELDQSYIPAVVSQLRSVLARFPERQP